MIHRLGYMERIKPWVGKPLIKVLTGLRRVGKSTLLRQIALELVAKHKIPSARVVQINLELMENETLRTAKALHTEIHRRLGNAKSKKAAVLLDEVQECIGWEEVVNSLLAEGGCDLYVTGSNAHLLSSELATKITGRYVEIPIYSLSFQEFLLFRGKARQNNEKEFSSFLTLGGFPGLHHLELTHAQEYLQSLYNTILLRDLVERNSVRDVKVLERILRFAFDNIGNVTTARSISEFLRSQKLDTAVRTVQSYLGFAENCYALYRVPRFDIKGKRHLEIGEKFYLGELGLRHGLLGNKPQDIAGLLENIVYLELRRRGAKVSVGKLGDKEVDFIAEFPGDKRVYIQVCYLLSTQKVLEREFVPLELIDDHYLKMVLSMDPLQRDGRQGIQWCNLQDWLLQKEWKI